MTALWILLVAVVVGALGFALGRSSRPSVAPVTVDEPAAPTASGGSNDAEVSAAVTDRLRERLGEAVDHVEQGVVVCDEHGVELFRNRVAQEYLDARDGRVLVDHAVGELLAEAVQGREARREVDLFGPPAQSFVVTAHPFDDDGVPGGLALVEDRSLQKRTETVRRDFVANISHELKTPIGALGLLAETIRDEPDVEVVARLAERMITEAERASCTVDDLLELSRIEFGDDAEFGEVAAIAVVGEACSRISSAAEHAEVTLSVEVDPTLVLHGDRRQLVSAMFNLLDNAVKYSPPGSEIVVASSLSTDPDQVHLDVVDAGIGIPRRDLDRIFERFYRVDRARSRGTGGTGLGLAIVRHVASNHDGEVTVESIEGVGSTFRLSMPLPIVRPAAPPTPIEPPSAADLIPTGDT